MDPAKKMVATLTLIAMNSMLTLRFDAFNFFEQKLKHMNYFISSYTSSLVLTTSSYFPATSFFILRGIGRAQHTTRRSL